MNNPFSRLLVELPLLIGLVLLWMLLWGQATWLAFVTGVAVAVIVTRVFYLPPIDLPGRVRPLALAAFLGRFATDVLVASFQVAWKAVRPRVVEHNSVIGVQLRTHSDFVMTVTAITLSLVPGTLVVEVDRDRAILYLHVIDTDDAATVERTRANVLLTEQRLVRALGSRDDVEKVDAPTHRDVRADRKGSA